MAQIYVLRQATFIFEGNSKTPTSEMIIAAYTNFESAQRGMEILVDSYEKRHYMDRFDREVELPYMNTIVCNRYGASFAITKTELFN